MSTSKPLRELPPGPIAREAVVGAIANLGVTEESPNWGKAIRQYLAAVNIFRPAAWCLAFVVFRLTKAAKQLGKELPRSMPRTGWTPSFASWAKEKGLVVSWHDARPGDLLLFWWPSLRRIGHVGFIEAISFGDYPYFSVIEGNGSKKGSREGTTVVRKTRPWASLDRRSLVVRFPW